MGWNRRYAIVSYLRSSLWTVPLFALVVEQIGVRFLTFIDQSLQWVPALEVTAAEAGDALATIQSLTIAFLVFTFGSMLVALQVASAQLTPRIIATTLLRDNTIRFTVGLFVFTLLLAVGTKARLHDPLPLAMVTVAIFAGIGSMAAFLFLIDYTARLLRPTAICQRVAERGMAVIEAVYPDAIEHPYVPRQRQPTPSQPARTVVHEGRSAVVLALNLKALIRLARDADGVIDFVPRVGDFVASAEPLFRLSGGTATLSDSTLRAQVAFGPERTMEQDATFAFRVIVDVAVKATVASHQRSDHGGSRTRSDPSTSARCRSPPLARRRRVRRSGGAPADPSDAQLGRLRRLGIQRNPPVRRIELPGDPAALRDHRRPDERPSGDEASRTASATSRTERYTRAAASPAGGPDARPVSRPAGAGWILNTI